MSGEADLQGEELARCRNCAGVCEPERRGWATPVCYSCLPPVRRKCAHCVHDAHIGMCTGRNGGTAYVCPCIHSSGGR